MPNTSASQPPPWEARYRRKRRHRGRGLTDLRERVGDVCAEIDARLGDDKVVRVLELGCGFGMALLDLVALYGPRVEAVGVTRHSADANRELQRSEARRRGIESDANVPMIVVADVSRRLPFADDSFDLVVSQVAWQYFPDKIGVLREVVRVLNDSGIARIDADEVDTRLPREYGRLVEIWHAGKLLPFGDYLRRYGFGFAAAAGGEFLRVEKCVGFGDDLALRFEIDLNQVDDRWDGIKCIYRWES